VSDRILHVEGLTVRFRGDDRSVYAVNGISFEVFAGEALAIVGESGSGKSVSMLSILKLLEEPPAEIGASTIEFDGRDICRASENDMRRIRGSKIGMIFQDPMTSLNPVIRIGYQLMEPLLVHTGMSRAQARRRAVELLHLVGIPDPEQRLNDFPHQFSGGMRQRVMIAIALSCDPMLFIADEPTTALDVTIQAQILDLAKRLRARLGMAMIWITHDLGVVAGLADRLVVMYGGFIVESGTVDAVFAKPLHPYTRALMRALPNPEQRAPHKLEPIGGMPPQLDRPPEGCPFAPRCQFAIAICRETNPQLEERRPGHSAACFVDISVETVQ
jgi:oligopeptide/dipeptide ABC transporter ATP-binding protein